MSWLKIIHGIVLSTSLACSALLGCDSSPVEDPLLREPVILSEAADLNRFLEQVARLGGTPIAAIAHEAQRLAADCTRVMAHFEKPSQNSGETNVDTRCVDVENTSPLIALAAERKGDHDGVLLWPVGEDGRIEIRFSVGNAGGLIADGILIPPTNVGLLGLMIPDAELPAEPVLNLQHALVQASARPKGGIGLAELIPSGGQADRMFALKGRLLEGALLSGTWEIGLLPPAPNRELPLPVGALHHRGEAATSAALSEALAQLEATWPIKRSPRTFTLASGAPLEGGCFLELPLLPELAPCWVVHPEALILGWRASAIDTALARPAVSAGENQSRLDNTAPARVDVHFDQFAQADSRVFGVKREANDLSDDESAALGQVFKRFSLRVAPSESGVVAFAFELPRQVQ